MAKGESADLVVVGAGTVGGWASVFAVEAGLKKVVVLERDVVGGGASSRAAGMVRAQGGTPDTVRLGAWSIDWYRRQDARYGTDSGFQGRGYVILAVTAADERAAHERIAMQRATGLDARWVGGDEVRRADPGDGVHGVPWWVLRRHRRMGRSSAERARLLARDAAAGRRGAGTDGVHGSAHACRRAGTA